MQPKRLAKKIASFAIAKKAHDVIIMDLRKLTDIADYFVIGSGDSDTQVKAIADSIAEGAENAGENVWRQEGRTERQWILLDFVDVVVHVFHKEARTFYNLEKLWGDAVIEEVKDKAPRKPKAVKKNKPATRRKRPVDA